MADTTIPSNGGWQKVRREFRVARFAPVITIRRGGALAISADFIRKAEISDCTRASLFLSPDGYRLGLRFHCDQRDDDAFIMSLDGGGKTSLNRLITAGALVRQSPVITALLREAGRTARRYEPWRDQHGVWVVDLAPCFERTVRTVAELDRNATGIYRYRFGADVIYIGRGRLFERASSPDRRGWEFDRIEFSVLNDDKAEQRWEAHWLNEHRDRYGRWPTYNRVGGIADKLAG